MTAGHNYIGTEHILLGLLREGEGVAARVLETLGATNDKIKTQVRFLVVAQRGCSCTCVRTTPLTASVQSNCLGASACRNLVRALKKLTCSRLCDNSLAQVIRMVGESQEAVGAGVGGGSSGSNKMPTLEEYGTNLTTQAEEVSVLCCCQSSCQCMGFKCRLVATVQIRCSRMCALHSNDMDYNTTVRCCSTACWFPCCNKS